MASEAPPTYDSLVHDINARVKSLGSTPNPNEVSDLFSNLSQAEKDILRKGHGDQKLSDLSDETHEKLALEVAKAISSKEAEPHLETAANLAADACLAVENMFLGLSNRLTTIDGKKFVPEKDYFAPKLQVIHDVRVPIFLGCGHLLTFRRLCAKPSMSAKISLAQLPIMERVGYSRTLRVFC